MPAKAATPDAMAAAQSASRLPVLLVDIFTSLLGRSNARSAGIDLFSSKGATKRFRLPNDSRRRFDCFLACACCSDEGHAAAMMRVTSCANGAKNKKPASH
jgi:hypothetical protein